MFMCKDVIYKTILAAKYREVRKRDYIGTKFLNIVKIKLILIQTNFYEFFISNH